MKDQITKLFGLADRNGNEEIRAIPVTDIVPSPYQPRTVFDDDRIEELCQTIKTHGVIQPIVVRVRGGKYEIIAGERRWRAVQKLGSPTIPAVIREFNDSQAASIALIENLQREGLTAIEEAYAYQKLMVLHDLTQESLAQRIGKGQSTIANKIRLLHLSEPVKQAMMERKITERHARALLGLDNVEQQLKLLNDVLDKDLNVKQTEARVEFLKNITKTKTARKVSYSKDIRLAVNTIRQSVDLVSSSGLKIVTDENVFDDYYEFVIRIPKRQSK
ncbi:MAG: nucleoid occlusion protein [Paenibacillaceae bacterium]